MQKPVVPDRLSIDKPRSEGRVLRQLLGVAESRTGLSQLVGVHDALSARVAGFDGTWASSLCISVAAGRCERDEVTWPELAGAEEAIAEATERPVLLDGNDGRGGPNVARLSAQRVARCGIADTSLEDKAWPRVSSFGDRVVLPEPDAFSANFPACRDAVDQSGFVIVALTDAMVAGEPVGKAIDCAHAYPVAGADAVLVHSKHATESEIAAFMRERDDTCPIIAIRTAHPATPHRALEGLRLAAVIWASQLMRSSLAAMKETAGAILGRAAAACAAGETSLHELRACSNCGWCAPLAARR